MAKMKTVRPRFRTWEDETPATVQELMRFYLGRGETLNKYQVMSLIKPASPLEKVTQAFSENTPTPLQLPVLAFMSLLSKHLMDNECTLNIKGATIRPDIWTIVLAPSGAQKSFSFGQIEKACEETLGVSANFTAVAGAAAYVEELRDKNNGLWFADEFAQFLSQIEQLNSPVSQCKEYLLKTYDGKKIERKTKAETIEVDKPCLSIYALNTQESFLNKISDESFTDGFSQRFAYLIAKNDSERPYQDFSWFYVEDIQPKLKEAFNAVKNVTLHKEYVYSPEAWEAYETGFKTLLKYEVSESFYRRLMYRSFKYALLFHVANEKSTNIIDVEDVGYAMRLIEIHLDDLKELLALYNFSETAKKIEKIREKRKAAAVNGQSYEVRDVIRNMRNVNLNEAKQLVEFIQVLEKEEKKNENRR